MYKNLLIAAMLLATTALQAQTFKTEFKSKAEDRKVLIQIDKNDIQVETHTGSEIIIIARGFKPLPERAKGLRPVYNTATDNTGIGLEVTEKGNTIGIRNASGQEDATYTIKLPKKTALKVSLGFTAEDFKLENFDGEIEIDARTSDIELLNVTGSVIANCLSGDIIVTFESVSTKNPSSITSVSGFVDVTLPKDSKLNFDMRTYSGEVYMAEELMLELEKKKNDGVDKTDGSDKENKTDFWGNSSHSSHYSHGGANMKAKMNGGGTGMIIHSASGDIYVRHK